MSMTHWMIGIPISYIVLKNIVKEQERKTKDAIVNLLFKQYLECTDMYKTDLKNCEYLYSKYVKYRRSIEQE